MKLLLIGYSKIAQRRVLPALAAAGITQVDVASRSRAGAATLPEGASGRVFDDYEAALAESEADLVYVSTVNSTHAEWAKRALQNGYHVIVDKPATTRLDDARRLVKLAQRQGRCLAESTVYGYHPQIAVAKQAFAEADSRPTRLTATFSFPPLPADNFRYKAACDGGALWDLGPYAITPGRIFFGEDPQEIACRITSEGDEVETSFSILMTYSDGRSMVGHFGFNTGYRNRLDILGPRVTVTIDRVFTAPANLANEVHINQNNQSKIITVPPADQFALFLRAVVSAIETGQHQGLADDLLSDARVLWRLKEAAGASGLANERISEWASRSE
jgi:predicted dehydrogenase